MEEPKRRRSSRRMWFWIAIVLYSFSELYLKEDFRCCPSSCFKPIRISNRNCKQIFKYRLIQERLSGSHPMKISDLFFNELVCTPLFPNQPIASLYSTYHRTSYSGSCGQTADLTGLETAACTCIPEPSVYTVTILCIVLLTDVAYSS